MPYYRKLPSGLWQATVRGWYGKRHTKTDKLKSVVEHWAAQQEAAIARGEFRDPHLGDLKVGDWYHGLSARAASRDDNGQACVAVAYPLRASGGAGRCPRHPAWTHRSGSTGCR